MGILERIHLGANGGTAARNADSNITQYLGRLGRINLEAMACGCLVFGYGTGALKEYLPPESIFEPDNLVEVAKRIESITNSFSAVDESLCTWSSLGRRTAENFSKEQEKTHLIAAWKEILGA